MFRHLAVLIFIYPALIESVYADNTITLKPLTVTAPYSGYQNESANTATRDESPVLSTPYSVGVINQSVLQDSLAYRLEDTAQFISGVQSSEADSGLSTDLRIRGFTTAGSNYLNGVLDNQRFQVRDMALVERVEILKGHSSVLYGAGSPGGTVNYVSKKPLAKFNHQVSYATGSYDFNRAVLDSTGPLNQDKSLLYRVIATGQLSDSFRENVANDRATIAPSLTWLYSKAGSINIDFEYGYQNQPFRFDNVFTRNKVVYDQSYVDPRARSDRHYWRFSTALDHQLSKVWSAHFASHYYHVERDDLLLGFFSFKTPDTLSGYYRDVHDHYDQVNFRSELRANFDWLGKHHWLVGVERNSSDARLNSQRRIGGFNLAIYQPNFNHLLPSTTQLDTDADQQELGFYSHDHFDIDKYWHISAGVRYSLFDADSLRNDTQHTLTKQDATTFSAGLSFTPTSQLAVYYGFSQSFQPNAGTDRAQRYFPAKKGQLNEVGIKTQWLNDQLVINAAAYHLKQSHLLGQDPIDKDYLMAIGEMISHGLELDVSGKITNQLQVLANYSWMEAEFGAGTAFKGRQFRSTPKHSGNLWFKYKVPLNLPGALYLGSGLVFADKRFGDDANSFTVPGYIRSDLLVHYQLDNFGVRFKVDNLFDKRYVSSSVYDDTVVQGNRLFFQVLFNVSFS